MGNPHGPILLLCPRPERASQIRGSLGRPSTIANPPFPSFSLVNTINREFENVPKSTIFSPIVLNPMRRTLALAFVYLAFLIPSHAGILAQFRTIFGDMDVELLEKDKPITVSNFLAYVQSGRYQNTFFHRCVPTFVIQGGGLD